MKPVRQLTQAEAQALFDYRDGMLYWRTAGSGRRRDLRAVTYNGNQTEINIGGERYQARYVIWNWHNGTTVHTIRPRDGNPWHIDIGNLVEVKKNISVQSPLPRAKCPCCDQPVSAPTFEVIAASLDLQPLHEKILKAIWDGKGSPVMTPRIFAAIYDNDPDGGPSDALMYSNFKVALCRLRARLVGSGVSIVTQGYRQGYKLVMEGNS